MKLSLTHLTQDRVKWLGILTRKQTSKFSTIMVPVYYLIAVELYQYFKKYSLSWDWKKKSWIN